ISSQNVNLGLTIRICRVAPGFSVTASNELGGRQNMDMQSAIVVKLPEKFNAAGARRLKQELSTKINNGIPRVVIDLSQVKNIDLRGQFLFQPPSASG